MGRGFVIVFCLHSVFVLSISSHELILLQKLLHYISPVPQDTEIHMHVVEAIHEEPFILNLCLSKLCILKIWLIGFLNLSVKSCKLC